MKHRYSTRLFLSTLIGGCFLLSLLYVVEVILGDATPGGYGASQTLVSSSALTDVQAAHPIKVSFAAETTLNIRDITTNSSGYPESRVPTYEKLEISFQVDTAAKNLQFPFDPDPPAGVDTSLDRYNGISVNAVFQDPRGNQYKQPAFYYQEFLEDESKDWYYPTENFTWKVRFAPNAAGKWQFKLQAQDESNFPSWEETDWQSFAVVESNNKGFIKVSATDPRYFEFDNGDYFPGLGYNENYRGIDWVKPVGNNQTDLEIMGQHGIQYARIWLSQWGIFGVEWTPWKFHTGNGYLQRHQLVYDVTPPESELTQRLHATLTDSSACMLNNFGSAAPPLKRNANYRIQIHYKTENIKGPKDDINPYGLVAKIGGWLWHDIDETRRCYYPGTGNQYLTPFQSEDTSDWQILEGYFNAGDKDFMDRLYIVLENVSEGVAYIDRISIQEDLGDGNYGANIIQKPDFDHHLYFDQRNSYAFDKVVELAQQNGVYLRPVILEKNDWIFNRIYHDGTFGDFGEDNENFYGDYRNNHTKMRWLQRAWWRYLQARWGYSPNIHSWELLNEGDPDVYNLSLSKVGRHQMLADELGKFMHCEAFDVAAGTTNSQHQCPENYDHPNDHMVSTSHWHSFPWHFWANRHSEYIDNGDDAWSFFNIDFADVHSYLNDATAPLFNDVALWVQTESLKWGQKLPDPASVGKPVIRGETALGDSDSPILQDTQGVWLHNFIWAQINAGGLYDSSWFQNGLRHIYNRSDGLDLRPLFKPYYDFISTIPLNNGDYDDAQAEVSHPDLRAWGQKDVVHSKAHLWIQNMQHTWRKVVDGDPIEAISGTVTISGLQPGPYAVEWWDTYNGAIIKTEMMDSDTELVLTLPQALDDDVAVKVSWAGPELSLSSKQVNRVAAQQGDVLTYTIRLVNSGASSSTVTLTDAIPEGTRYLPDSASVSPATGVLEVAAGIRWTGTLSDTAVTVAFAVVIEAEEPTHIINRAYIDDGVSVVSKEAKTIANGYTVYLPVILRH
jgi:uncharacterized repeat protein (TIGR01451 family)